MPIPILFHIFEEGLDSVPWLWTAIKIAPVVGVIYLIKTYFEGMVNRSERLMHGKVILVTGGTSGIGAHVVRDLATRGAQIILLTQQASNDPFLQEYIEDLREQTNNELIYAETVNLASLYSIRKFATKWVDNAPPRRLDMIVLCASTFKPRYGSAPQTLEGVEGCWGVNYLANFHLLSILSPALRAQPADRDVRVVVATCGSYVGGDLKHMKNSKAPLPENVAYETSKLATMVFAQAYQKHLDDYKRPDKMPMNSRVIMVDPGWVRTPGMRRWLSMGSLWGLLLYLVMWPIYWLVLKSPASGAQSFLHAAMEADYGRGLGGRFIRECRDWKYARPEINDAKAQKELWEYSEKQIAALEKEAAANRTSTKNESTGAEESAQGPNAKTKSAGASTASQKERQPSSRRGKKTT